MCYGWEPDDIIEIITNLQIKKETKSLEIIESALKKNALKLGETYKAEDYPNISLSSFIKRWYTGDTETIILVKNEPDEIIIKIKECKIYEIFKKLDHIDIGYQYKCKQDYSIIEGYDNSINFKIEKCLMKGDKHCLLHLSKTKSHCTNGA